MLEGQNAWVYFPCLHGVQSSHGLWLPFFSTGLREGTNFASPHGCKLWIPVQLPRKLYIGILGIDALKRSVAGFFFFPAIAHCGHSDSGNFKEKREVELR